MRNSILTGLLLAGFLSLPSGMTSQTPGSSIALAAANNQNRDYNQYMREDTKKPQLENLELLYLYSNRLNNYVQAIAMLKMLSAMYGHTLIGVSISNLSLSPPDL